MIKAIINEYRHLICGFLFRVILTITPKDDDDGILVVSLIEIWARRSFFGLREE